MAGVSHFGGYESKGVYDGDDNSLRVTGLKKRRGCIKLVHNEIPFFLDSIEIIKDLFDCALLAINMSTFFASSKIILFLYVRNLSGNV